MNCHRVPGIGALGGSRIGPAPEITLGDQGTDIQWWEPAIDPCAPDSVVAVVGWRGMVAKEAIEARPRTTSHDSFTYCRAAQAEHLQGARHWLFWELGLQHEQERTRVPAAERLGSNAARLLWRPRGG